MDKILAESILLLKIGATLDFYRRDVKGWFLNHYVIWYGWTLKRGETCRMDRVLPNLPAQSADRGIRFCI